MLTYHIGSDTGLVSTESERRTIDELATTRCDVASNRSAVQRPFAITLLIVFPALIGESAGQGAVSARPPSGGRQVPSGWSRFQPGSFQMGCVPADPECHANETPRHRVTLTRGFLMMRTEVTVGTFSDFFEATGIRLPRQPLWNETGNHPVVNVTWEEARSFCERAFGGRLPTEAEWEHAARGGARDGKYPWGETYDATRVNGADGARTRDGWPYTSPVGSFPPNSSGLFDVLGNVWEWTNDRYAAAYYARTPEDDPSGPPTGVLRSVRGGSWDSAPRQLRLSVRSGLRVRARFPLYVGFRCAVDEGGDPPPVPIPRNVSETRPGR
jgi:formylglycine-generating enzyme required for sulfatase activity